MSSPQYLDGFVRRSFDENITAILKLYSSYVEKIVDYGGVVINWHPVDELEDDTAISTMMLRHLIETTDAISILIKNGSSEPCKILLRTAFETTLYLNFICENDTKRRAYSYVVVDAFNQIRNLEKIHSNTERGKELKNVIDTEGYIDSTVTLFTDEQIEEKLDRYKRFLTNPLFEKIVLEYQAIKKKYKKPPVWYQLFNGPSTIAQLAVKLNRKIFYDILYKPWSDIAHGADIYDKKMFQSTKETFAIADIRLPLNLAYISKMACNFCVFSYGNYTIRRHQERIEEYKLWETKFTADVDFDLTHEYISFSP